MLTVEQRRRIEHPDWPLYLDDANLHWGALIDIGVYDGMTSTNVGLYDEKINGLMDIFRQTFYPQLDE